MPTNSKDTRGCEVQLYRVCVADQCAEDAAMLCSALQANCYDAYAVTTGNALLEVCQETPPDVVLVSPDLPDMSLEQIWEKLPQSQKENEAAFAFLPVLPKGARAEHIFPKSIPFFEQVEKPYNPPMVMIAIDSTLRSQQKTDTGNTDFLPDTVYTDTLTGLRNRRFLLERLQEEVEKAHRHDYPLSCVMLDIDDVNAIDQELGEAPLDDLIAEVAMTMRELTRNYDILARYEGARFAAILPHAPLPDAIAYAHKIRDEITSTFFCDPVHPTQANLRFGVVTCRNGSSRNAEDLLGEALRNLLRAATNTDQRIVARDLNAGV